MSKQYNLAVFIGRFQPFHLGHLTVINKALEIAEQVLVLIGSVNEPRTLRNPFTYAERIRMISDSIGYPHNMRLMYGPIEDHLYNDTIWIESIQREVFSRCGPDSNVVLIGHSKDNTSYYLKLFPQWDSVNCEQEHILNSTNIRESYFAAGPSLYISDNVPAPVNNFLIQFSETETYNTLVDEQVFVDNYKAKFAGYPFPPTFVTVDAVVVQSGHVLLVKRKGFPGRGLWALPGGFLNQSEKIEDACIRELREETRIKVPAPVLHGSIVKSQVFDDPHRSSRGRTITHAFYIHLSPDLTLPKVRGSDDAEKAKWIPLSAIRRSEMFEDHYSIIESMVGTI